MGYFECCHGCVAPKRYPGCSGKCPDYAEARAKFDVDKAKNNENISLKYYINETSARHKDYSAKYTKRRPKRFYK